MREQHQKNGNVCLDLEETVDLSSADSFPASDPPAWTPTHAGAPLSARSATWRVREEPELFHDVVQHIRDDVHLLISGTCEPHDLVSLRCKDVGWPAKTRPEESRNVEAVIRGDANANESVIVAARADNASGLIALLGVARSLARLPKMPRTIRLVALTGFSGDMTAYLDDLIKSGPKVRAVLRLEMGDEAHEGEDVDCEALAHAVPHLVDAIRSLSCA